MRTRAPPARRDATTHAMFVQLARLETLVPPNFRTIQAEGVRVTALYVLAAHATGWTQTIEHPQLRQRLRLERAGRGKCYSSSSKSFRSFSSFRSASTSSSRLQAALPRLPWFLTRLSTRSRRRS